VVDAITVLITHLTETIKAYAHELLGRQEVKSLIDMVREKQPAVIEELLPDLLTVGEIQKVMQNLLRERVPVRDLVTIFESMADHARNSRDIDLLTEYVRQALSRTICNQYVAADGKLHVVTLDPRLEQVIADSLQQSSQGTYPVMEPQHTQRIFAATVGFIDQAANQGQQPVVLCSSRIRLPFRRLADKFLPNLTVLSFSEIIPGIEVESVGMVNQG
jgi:flagellar biosynthesis protein FlhA